MAKQRKTARDDSPEGGVYSGFQGTGTIRGFFGGVKFSILGFCRVGKLDFLGVFKTFWRSVIIPSYPGCIVLQIKFYGSEIQHGVFWGLNFGPGIFLGGYFWVLIFAPSRSSLPLEVLTTQPPPPRSPGVQTTSHRVLNLTYPRGRTGHDMTGQDRTGQFCHSLIWLCQCCLVFFMLIRCRYLLRDLRNYLWMTKAELHDKQIIMSPKHYFKS